MEQERINQILEEKRALDILRQANVLIDPGDHRSASEIMHFLEAMGVIAVATTCRYRWLKRGRSAGMMI